MLFVHSQRLLLLLLFWVLLRCDLCSVGFACGRYLTQGNDPCRCSRLRTNMLLATLCTRHFPHQLLGLPLTHSRAVPGGMFMRPWPFGPRVSAFPPVAGTESVPRLPAARARRYQFCFVGPRCRSEVLVAPGAGLRLGIGTRPFKLQRPGFGMHPEEILPVHADRWAYHG